MIELKVINKIDPLKRNAEKQISEEEYSPMDPPDAYAPPKTEEVTYEDMHPFLQELMDDHKVLTEKLKAFEETLINIQQEGINKKAFNDLATFFEFFDQTVVKHHQKEEKTIFPLLHKKLRDAGDHGKGQDEITGVNMMEDDHIKGIQLAAVIFNFFGIAMKLPDPTSRLIMLDTAIEQGKILIEDLRLHIFREDHIIFAQANQHITASEFEGFQEIED